jgi:hypothetical protein
MTRTLSAENLKQSSRDFPVGPLAPIEQFIMFVGPDIWAARLADIAARSASANRLGGVIRQAHALELALERLRSRGLAGTSAAAAAAPSVAEQKLHEILIEAVSVIERLSPPGAERLRERLRAGMHGDRSLVESFHLFRTSALHQARGFSLSFTGLEQGTPYDFLLSRDGVEMECVCETVSAEAGRDVHRRAWAQFCDRIEGQMKPWLGTRPGRYLLKMTLARGLRDGRTEMIDGLQARVLAMLEGGTRLDQDETAVLRVEPLATSGASSTVESLMTRLRREFGPEAHLSVSASADGVWAMAARAGRRNEVAAVIRAHLDRLAPGRVSGERPAILSLFVEDLDRAEWRGLRESLELEGAARHFMTCAGAASVVAVTCYSRMEMFGLTGPDAVAEGELRFRNPAHPAAKNPALAPAILSSV